VIFVEVITVLIKYYEMHDTVCGYEPEVFNITAGDPYYKYRQKLKVNLSLCTPRKRMVGVKI
jgi:hypothetical protein